MYVLLGAKTPEAHTYNVIFCPWTPLGDLGPLLAPQSWQQIDASGNYVVLAALEVRC